MLCCGKGILQGLSPGVRVVVQLEVAGPSGPSQAVKPARLNPRAPLSHFSARKLYI